MRAEVDQWLGGVCEGHRWPVTGAKEGEDRDMLLSV